MKVFLINHTFEYECSHIAKIFLSDCDFQIRIDTPLSSDTLYITSKVSHFNNRYIVTTALYAYKACLHQYDKAVDIADTKHMTKRQIKREVVRQLYSILKAYYKTESQWGVLVGVRPTKLCHELMDSGYSDLEIEEILSRDYFIAKEKITLLIDICHRERKCIYPIDDNKFSMYLSIPFCPSRCLYCSFPSNVANKDDAVIDAYTKALIRELKAVHHLFKNRKIDTLYFGGGTPAMLNSTQIIQIVNTVKRFYDTSDLREFTFEAGRPDVIDEVLLKTLKEVGVNRICINPQTMNNHTLKALGRKHTVSQIEEAMALVRRYDFASVNMDIITGLIGETVADIAYTIDGIIKMKPENITVHTLALKRASKLKGEIKHHTLPTEEIVKDQLEMLASKLKQEAYAPYYMYRQKYILGNFENIGYALEGHESIYNIMIIEERQSIIAFGAGAASKLYYPKENRLIRIPNVKNLKDYIDRVDEMASKKIRALKSEA